MQRKSLNKLSLAADLLKSKGLLNKNVHYGIYHLRATHQQGFKTKSPVIKCYRYESLMSKRLIVRTDQLTNCFELL